MISGINSHSLNLFEFRRTERFLNYRKVLGLELVGHYRSYNAYIFVTLDMFNDCIPVPAYCNSLILENMVN